VGKQAGPHHDKRPRSPNPNAMPKSLTTTPPLKPSLDPSAKSWVEIAVSQRGSGGSPRSGQRAEGIARNGAQQKHPAAPGAALDGLLCNCASAVTVACFDCSLKLIAMHHCTCIQDTESCELHASASEQLLVHRCTPTLWWAHYTYQLFHNHVAKGLVMLL